MASLNDDQCFFIRGDSSPKVFGSFVGALPFTIPLVAHIRRNQMLRVIVVLEFNGINDADSEKASNITDSITDECLILQHELGADACYVDDVVVEIEEEEETYDEFGVNTKNSFNTPPKESK
jgi:hypothetical protein